MAPIIKRRRSSEPSEKTVTEEQLKQEAQVPEQPVNGFQVNASLEQQASNSGSVAVRYKDGKADPNMRESTWNKLAEVLRATPGAMERLGLVQQGKKVELITAEKIEPFYTGIGMLNTFLAIRFMRINSQIAGTIIPYSEIEKASLSSATAEAINQNFDKLPKWFVDFILSGGNVSVAKLCMVLFEVHYGKLQAIKIAQGKSGEQRPEAVN